MGLRIAVLSFVLVMLFLLMYLTYLFLFAVPEKPPVDAKSRDNGDYHIIGPVNVETHPEQKSEP